MLFKTHHKMEPSIITPILEELAKGVYKTVSKFAKTNNKTLKVNDKNIENALEQHLSKVTRFSSEISFKDMAKPKTLFSVYIPLEIALQRINHNEEDNQIGKSSQSENIIASTVIEKVFIESNNNVVLIGVPGAGKTTTLKYICQRLLFDEFFLGDNINFPLLIRLREDEVSNNQSIPLFEYILNVFGIIIENLVKCSDPVDDKNQLDLFKKQTAIKILDEHSPILILDGIDEVSDDVIKSRLIKNINEISLSSKNTKFILTTRKGDNTFHIDNTQIFELASLSDEQIKCFINKWIGEEKANDFFVQLFSSSVYDTAKRPLTLSHLCAIFEREGRIPQHSRSIYRKIVNLLILEWNLENQIDRRSKFSNFEPDRKKEFLENLAFEISVLYNKNQFTTNDLEKCYRNLYHKFGLPIMQMNDVINEIQVHNGLITQITFDTFEFAHKSFQEYLAAEYIVRLPKLINDFNLNRIPSEMALAVTLSSEPSEYLLYFIEEFLVKWKCDFTFLNSFFARIAIEKPEFSESLPLTLSLLNLHSKYCAYTINDGEQNKLKQANDYTKILNESFDSIMCFPNINSGIRSLWYNGFNISCEQSNLTYYKIVEPDIGNKKVLNQPIYTTEEFYINYLSSLQYP